jgi:G3E family GTPase
MPDLPLAESTPRSRFQAKAVSEIAGHERDFRRWCYRRDGQFDRARLQTALADLPPSLLRLKGPCRFVGEDQACLLQLVGRDWSLTVAADGEFSDAPDVSILLVGVGTADLPETCELDLILDRALVPAAGAAASRQLIDGAGVIPQPQSS